MSQGNMEQDRREGQKGKGKETEADTRWAFVEWTLSYLHAEAGFRASEGQNFDFDPLPFAHHVGHVSNTPLAAQL